MKKCFAKLETFRNLIPNWLVYLFSIPVTLLCCFVLLEIPTVASWGMPFSLSRFLPKYVILNILTLGILWSLIFILSHRVWLSNLLTSVICGLIAVINYYVVTLHGMPLSFLLLRNLGTALNVMGNYSIDIDRTVLKMLLLWFALLCLALVTMFFTTKPKTRQPLGRRLLGDGALLLACCVTFYVGYLGGNPIKPSKTIAWAWQEAYSMYGYTSCTVETFFQLFTVANKPAGYSQEAVSDIAIDQPEQRSTQTPDIILILNESFSDLSALMELETDSPYLNKIPTIDNLLTGYAISPAAGGSTNNSEYEVLCSNSLWLMPGITPFNTLELGNANSIVSNLNRLGYYTLGSHSEKPTNYSRLTGYRDLGFQDTYFWEDFQNKTYYADRQYPTDESLYKNIIRWYHAASEDTPRFLYLLTMQNHGSHRASDDSNDLIHVQTDLGKYETDTNEYLTSLSLSDSAFAGLTEYFSQSERPVIICMLGDHIPAFAINLVKGQDSAETNLLQRKVPLLIWANFPLEQQDLGTMSMNYVVPTLLDIAGIPLSPYYSYMLQLKEQVPILTAYGDYYDAQGNRYTYDSDEGAPYQQAVDNYFYLEYENLQKNRNQSLFEPYTK